MMRTVAIVVSLVFTACLLPGDEAATTTDHTAARAAAALAELDAMHDEALALAPIHDQITMLAALDPAVAAATTPIDVDATLEGFDRYADALGSILGHAQQLQELAAREAAASEVAATPAALTEESGCPSSWLDRVWAQWRGYSSNVTGGPVPVDNLLSVSEQADKVRDELRAQLEQKRAACDRIRNVSEQHLCIARVDAELRPLLVGAASKVVGTGGFAVIKALGSAAVGAGAGAALGVLIGVGSGGTVVLGAVGATLFESAVDYFLVPADELAAGAPAGKPVALLRSPSGSAGTTSFELPVGRYQVIGRVRASGAVTTGEVQVEPGGTAELPRPSCETTPTAAPDPAPAVPAAPVPATMRSCGGMPWNGDRCYFVWSAPRYKCDLVDRATYRYEWRPHAVPYYRGFAVCQPDHLSDFVSCDPLTGTYSFDFVGKTMEEHVRARLAEAANWDCLSASDLSNVVCNAPWLLRHACGTEAVHAEFALGTQDANAYNAFLDAHRNESSEGPMP